MTAPRRARALALLLPLLLGLAACGGTQAAQPADAPAEGGAEPSPAAEAAPSEGGGLGDYSW